MPWGTHFSLFYETRQDLLDAVTSYLRAGLENHEFCLWVIPEPLTDGEARAALRQAIPDIDRYLAERSMELLPNGDCCFKGGASEVRGVIHRFHAKLDQALMRGYAGIRVTANPNWPQKKDWRSFCDYGSQLSESIANQRMIVLCTFSLAASGAIQILDAARSRQRAVALRNGNWAVVESGELNRAKVESGPNEELEHRVAERTRALAAANEEHRREIAERDQVEDELRKMNEVLQQVFDHVPALINFIGRDGRIRLVNRAWERTLGWSLEELSKNDLDIFAELYPNPQYRHHVLSFVASSAPEWAEFKTRVRDGRVIDTTWVNVRLSDGTGIGFGQDITERKQAEERLQATSDQLRALSANTQSAREEERTRVARMIHDELGSALTSLRWDLEGLDKTFSELVDHAKLAAARARVASMMRLADNTINAVRRIAWELRPSILDDLGLVEAIQWHAQQFEARTGIICRRDGFPENVGLNREQSTAIFRIFQEALTNILRHAQATKVDITMERRDGELVLTIRDNGKGITGIEKSGLGISGMQERARLVNAKIDITGGEGKGTVITVRITTPAEV